MSLYPVRTLLIPSRHRPRPDLRGTVNDVCHVEQRVFRALTSAEGGSAIRESSAVRIGVRRAGELGCEWEGVYCVETQVEDEGSEAMHAGR